MSHKNLLRSSIDAYHVTARSNNQEWFYLHTPEVWKIMCKHLFTVSIVYKAKIHSFVLMSNHFHLLITTPDKNLDDIMMYFMRETSREINFISNRTNHVFGGRYKWSLIQKPSYFALAYTYIYHNPVRARICTSAEAYEFSSLQWIIGLGKVLFPISYPSNNLKSWIPIDPFEQIAWLNNSKRINDHSEKIRLELKRSVFRPSFTP